MKASEAGQVECVKLLLNSGAQVSMLDKVSPPTFIHCEHSMLDPSTQSSHL